MSAVAVIAIVFTFVTRVLVVSGASMNPTLNNGDTVAISSLKRSFDYGDIVIVAQPNAMHKTLIKRVIAVGGQTVDIDTEKGVVYVDGKVLDEKYTLEPTYSRGNIEFPQPCPRVCSLSWATTETTRRTAACALSDLSTRNISWARSSAGSCRSVSGMSTIISIRIRTNNLSAL